MPHALLILGAAVWPGGQASPTLERRTRHAAKLFHGGDYACVIASGGLGRHPPTEAETMAAILRDAGLPPGAILPEPRATNTEENFALSVPLLQQRGITQVTVVTEYYHLPRALMTAKRHGLKARGRCPAPSLRKTPLRRHLYAIGREAVALPVYWWRYRR